MEYVFGEDWHQYGVGHAHQADNCQEQQNIADGQETKGVVHACLQVFQEILLRNAHLRGSKPHREQSCNNRNVAEAIEKEAHAFPNQ